MKGSSIIAIITTIDLAVSIFILLLFIEINNTENDTKVLGIPISLLIFYMILSAYFILLIAIILWYKNVNVSQYFLKNTRTTLELHSYFTKSFPYFLISFLILVGLYFYSKDILHNNFYHGLFQGFIIILQIQLLLFSIYTALSLNKNYYFYKSKAYIDISTKSQDEQERIEFIFSGIEIYDKYLQRRLKIKIKNLNKIKEKILENDNFIDIIYKNFDTHLSFVKLIQISFKDDANLFEHITYGWWKDMDKNAIIIAIITSIITLIQIFWK